MLYKTWGWIMEHGGIDGFACQDKDILIDTFAPTRP